MLKRCGIGRLIGERAKRTGFHEVPMVEVSESTLSHMHALPEDVQECAIDPTGAFSARSRG
jgi:hypothetical protein